MARRPGNSRRNVRSIGLSRPNTLGLGERELDVVLDEFDEMEATSATPRQRDFVRWPYRLSKVPFHVRFRDGQESSFDVACRNLSSGGVSVLHRTFMHVGTKCAIELPQGRTKRRIEGVVVRCEHRQGMVHEIGVKFNEPIHALEFVEPDEFTDCFSMERVSPEMLQGTMVHVEDSTMDQRIVKHFLRETRVRVRPAGTCEEGAALIREGCDLVLCDLHLPDRDGATLLEEMRAEGVQTPWIIITSDTSPATKLRLERTSTSAFLAKPVDQDLLLRAVAEYLMIGRDKSMLHCTLAPNDPAMALVDAYVRELREAGGKIEQAMKASDVAAARHQCLTLKGNAATFGFAAIGTLAEEAMRALDGSGSLVESSTAFRALVNACQRASVGSA